MKRLIVLFILLILPVVAGAQVFKWVDETGKTNFTDDISKVPPQFHNQIQTNKNSNLRRAPKTKSTNIPTPEKPTTNTSAGQSDSNFLTNKLKYTTDEEGNIYVKTVINDRLMVELLFDSTQNSSSINYETAGKLGLGIDLTDATKGKMSMQVRIDSFRFASLEIKDIRIEITDMASEGILGRDILSEFSYKIDKGKEEITFQEKSGYNNKKYGGHSQKWWESEFAYTRNMLNKAKELYEQETDPQRKNTLQDNKLAWEIELKELEGKAIKSSIPINWQKGTVSAKSEEEKYSEVDEKWWRKEYQKTKQKLKDIDAQVEDLKTISKTNPLDFSYQQGDLQIINLGKQKEEVLKKLEELDNTARKIGIPKEWK